MKNSGTEQNNDVELIDTRSLTVRPEILARRPAQAEMGANPWASGPRPQGQLAHAWNVALDYKLLISAVFLLSVGLAAMLALVQPSGYRATTTIELLGVNQDFLNLKQIDPTMPLSANSDRGDSYTQTQLELLKRDVLIERVVKKLHMDQNPAFVSHRSLLSHLPLFRAQEPKVIDPRDRVRMAVRAAQKKLRVQQLRQSNLVEISFQDSDPDLAVAFANTLAQEAVDENMRSRWDLSRNVRAWLERHLTSLREKVDEAERELQRYTAGAGIMPAADTTAADDPRLHRLQDQLASAQTDRIHKESHYLIARSADPSSLPEVLDDGAYKDYQVRLEELRRQQAELSTTLTPDHPKVLRVQAQIAELQRTIADERSNILARLRNEYAASKREEQAVGAAFAEQASKASASAQKEIHYNTLKRELETTRTMYEDVLKQLNDTELVSVTRASGMRIIDPATAPEKQDLMQTRVFIGGVGAFAGLLVAGLLVFVLDQANNTVKGPGHMRALLNVPELGIIPPIGKSRRNALSQAPGPRVAALESFHSVITSILFALERGEGNRMIAVTSPGAGEGKTTVTANLGIVLSKMGHRVLLIDADIRRPSLHSMFGMTNNTGFTDILCDAEPLSRESVKASLQRVPTGESGNLHIITAGEQAIGAFSVMHSRRAGELAEVLRKDYDLILVDTPPLLLVPESRVLGRMTDRCILVFRAGRTTMDAVLSARQRMAEDGIPLLGTILNDCNPRQSSYHYYGDYSRSANG